MSNDDMTDFSTAAPAIHRQEAAAGGVSAPRDDSSDGLSSETAGEHVREAERIIEQRGDPLQIPADHDRREHPGAGSSPALVPSGVRAAGRVRAGGGSRERAWATAEMM
jgi:hypothetical protein